jgi:hypothetical protein
LNGLIVVPKDKSFISDEYLPATLSADERRDKVKELAGALDSIRDQSKLAMGQIFHEITTNNYYSNWGYESFDAWLKDSFENDAAYGRQIRDTYVKWMVDLPGKAEVIGKIKFTKLVLLKAHVTAENFDEMVKFAQTAKFSEIKEKLSELSGKPTESRGGTKKYNFQLTEEQSLIADQALEIAQELCESDIPGKAYEYIFNSFVLDEGIVQGRAVHLAKILRQIESVYDIKVSIDEIGNTVDGVAEPIDA